MRGREKEVKEVEVTLVEAPQELNIAPCGGLKREDNVLPADLPVTEALEDLNSQLGVKLYKELTFYISWRELSALIYAEAQKCLFQATDNTREKARLRCLQRAGAGDWLCALPSQALSLHLQRMELAMAGWYRLGIRVFGVEGRCHTPHCRSLSNTLRDHSLAIK